jgi:multisubunit Na+/H+ antiporter MnhG subunit
MTSDAASGAGSDDAADSDAYGGLLGAFPYAARASESRLFRVYAPVAALLAGLLTLLFGLSLLALVAGTAGMRGGSVTLSRAFFVLVGLLVAAPVVAAALFDARRHRRRAAPPSARPHAGVGHSGVLVLVGT